MNFSDPGLYYSYDSGTDSCIQINYKGCEGNRNRFESNEECLDICKRVQPPFPTISPLTVSRRTRELARVSTEVIFFCFNRQYKSNLLHCNMNLFRFIMFIIILDCV